MSRILYEIIPDSKDIDRELVLAAKYGMAFEYNDFMNPDQLDDKEYCRQKIVFYKNLGRNMSMTHFMVHLLIWSCRAQIH